MSSDPIGLEIFTLLDGLSEAISLEERAFAYNASQDLGEWAQELRNRADVAERTLKQVRATFDVAIEDREKAQTELAQAQRDYNKVRNELNNVTEQLGEAGKRVGIAQHILDKHAVKVEATAYSPKMKEVMLELVRESVDEVETLRGIRREAGPDETDTWGW